ncbi:MAG: hypothetical protein GF384_02680 [Elusimicrobia bacterium]|nr:hypothetical protein [Elusimicrobiota bacterium]MBD3411863.1 hypothetical protein [Elusimicrobiota bacterium]
MKDKNRLNHQRGFTLLSVVFFFLVASIVSYALVLRQGREMVMTSQNNSIKKARQLADAGLAYVVKQLRINPTYERTMADNISDPLTEFNGKGEIFVTANHRATPITGAYVLVISSGIYHAGKNEVVQVVQAIAKTENPGNYFCATSSKFVFGPNSNFSLGGGTVYSNIVEFVDHPLTPPGTADIAVYRVKYHTDTIPNDPSSFVSSTYSNPFAPEYFSSPVTLPIVSLELMIRYWEYAQMDIGSGNSVLDPAGLPAGLMGQGTEANPLTGTLPDPPNDTGIWFWPSHDPEISPTEDLYIRDLYNGMTGVSGEGGMVAINGDLYIQGGILEDPLPGNNYIGFAVKGNVYVDANYDSPHTAASTVRIDRTLLIAPNGKFVALINPGNAPLNQFSFNGAALFRDSFDLARGFKNRFYGYRQNVKFLPNLPYMAWIDGYEVSEEEYLAQVSHLFSGVGFDPGSLNYTGSEPGQNFGD